VHSPRAPVAASSGAGAGYAKIPTDPAPLSAYPSLAPTLPRRRSLPRPRSRTPGSHRPRSLGRPSSSRGSTSGSAHRSTSALGRGLPRADLVEAALAQGGHRPDAPQHRLLPRQLRTGGSRRLRSCRGLAALAPGRGRRSSRSTSSTPPGYYSSTSHAPCRGASRWGLRDAV